ncbi:hypothetical protein JOE66_002672 [Subtercola frigoramans]|uniref:Uncharacterized protein n=1 Tax=Subtercola frigoramans TaxID=120298 RepID=A0ABS2L7H3_9MICO|nr:hypothetical protein [Subtercola frigoramans]
MKRFRLTVAFTGRVSTMNLSWKERRVEPGMR